MSHTRSLHILALVLLAVCSPTEGSGQKILRNVVVYEEAGQYMAWPSIVRTGPKELVVFFCRSEEHLGPMARSSPFVRRTMERGGSSRAWWPTRRSTTGNAA